MSMMDSSLLSILLSATVSKGAGLLDGLIKCAGIAGCDAADPTHNRKENGQVRVCVGLEVTVNPQQLESETQVKTLVFMCDLTLT